MTDIAHHVAHLAQAHSRLPNGDRVLILVRQVKDGDASEMDTET